MAIIYTNQSSGAIRRLRNKKPTKAYKEALKKHIKYLQKLGFNCDDTGRIQRDLATTPIIMIMVEFN